MKMFLKSSILLVIIILLSGCSSEASSFTTGEGVKKCSREATVTNGSSSMNYELYYKGEYIVVLHSVEKIISDDSNVLDTYEEAYNNIFKYYEGLKYYDNKIIRDENSVTSDTTINYEKIDIGKLLDIEGEEDNVIEDGKVKLETWLSFAKKLGVTCED